ncbi:MAG: hypothetical protein Tsb0021_08910 [Chlamydiales bacterium]
MTINFMLNNIKECSNNFTEDLQNLRSIQTNGNQEKKLQAVSAVAFKALGFLTLGVSALLLWKVIPLVGTMKGLIYLTTGIAGAVFGHDELKMGDNYFPRNGVEGFYHGLNTSAKSSLLKSEGSKAFSWITNSAERFWDNLKSNKDLSACISEAVSELQDRSKMELKALKFNIYTNDTIFMKNIPDIGYFVYKLLPEQHQARLSALVERYAQ